MVAVPLTALLAEEYYLSLEADSMDWYEGAGMTTEDTELPT